MKNIFLINEEEKKRIITLHETATKKHYLSEQNFDLNDPLRLNQNSKENQVVSQGESGDPYQYMKWNDKVWYAKKSEGKNPKWVEAKTKDSINAIRSKIFNQQITPSIPNPEKKRKSETNPVKQDSVKSDKKVKKQQISKYNYSPRIDAELKYIIERDLDDKPFFIYDGKDNLLYFFNKSEFLTSPKLIDYTSVVDGGDVQKDAKPFTISDWCKVSKNKNGKFLLDKPYNCTDPDTKEKKLPTYGNLVALKQRFLSKGIYSINYLSQNKGYVGTGKNVFNLKDSEGNQVAAAIHGIPAGIPKRLTASKELESLLNREISSGRVPQEYLESTKQIANANQSYGCIGVPAKFIENPKVQTLAKEARVFVMGQSNKDFLVQNATEYFDKIGSQGDDKMDAIMIAQNMSDNDNNYNTAVA